MPLNFLKELMTIKFTKRAKTNFESIKKYLQNEWGSNVVRAFEQKTMDFLALLEQYPLAGSVEVKEKQIRGLLLTKNTKIFYRIKNGVIIILSFFDVRQNPDKMPK